MRKIWPIYILWALVFSGSVAFSAAGDHSDIEPRKKLTLQSLPGSLPPSKLDPAAANQCLCGPVSAGPSVAPVYRAITVNDLPAGLPPGLHATTHESGGTDPLLVNASTTPNKVYASPASGGAGVPAYRALVLADLPVASANVVLAGPSSGGATTPSYRSITSLAAPATGINATAISSGLVTNTNFNFLVGLSDYPIGSSDARICPISGANKLYYDSGSACTELVAPASLGQAPVYNGSAIAWTALPSTVITAWVLSPNSSCSMAASGITCSTTVTYYHYVSDGVRTVKNLRCSTDSGTNYSGGSVTFTVYKNFATSGAACTISGTNTTCTNNTVLTLAQYDKVNIQNTATGGPWTNRSAWCSVDVY